MTAPLLIGVAFVAFVALLLWWLAGWSVAARRHGGYAVAGGLALAGRAGLVMYGLHFSASAMARPRFQLEQLLGPAVLPLFLALPVAVCIVVSQLLLRSGVCRQKTKVAAVVLAAASAAAAPFAALVAGCGLAGVCL